MSMIRGVDAVTRQEETHLHVRPQGDGLDLLIDRQGGIHIDEMQVRLLMESCREALADIARERELAKAAEMMEREGGLP